MNAGLGTVVPDLTDLNPRDLILFNREGRPSVQRVRHKGLRRRLLRESLAYRQLLRRRRNDRFLSFILAPSHILTNIFF